MKNISSTHSLPKNPFILLVVLIFAIGVQVQAATRTASVTGDWSSTTTWGGAAVPTVNDDVIIGSGVTLTIDISGASCATLTMQATDANSVMSFSGSNSLTVSGLVSMVKPASGKSITINVHEGLPVST